MKHARLVLAASFMAASSSAAQVVRYDNSDGTFVWTPLLQYYQGYTVVHPVNFDVSLSPADNQAGLAGQNAFLYYLSSPASSNAVMIDKALSGSAQFASGQYVEFSYTGDRGYAPVHFNEADTIGPNQTYRGSAALAGRTISDAYPLWQAETIIVGFRFPADDTGTSFHYGYAVLEWHELIPFPDIFGGTHQVSTYQPTMWAYETTPDTPITAITEPDCPADTDGDGSVTPADFSAWVAAFNASAPECDQNDDGSCTPADFSAWVANYNAGC